MNAPIHIVGLSAPELSLLFFFGVFVGMVVWLVLSKSSRWGRDARIPLDELPQDEIAAIEAGRAGARSAAPDTTTVTRATREGTNHG